MKKLILTVAGMLLVSLMAVNAQVEPSTEMNQDTTQSSTQTPGVMGDDQSNYSRDMEVIQPTDVPQSLRTTLEGTEYSGWEEGKVYRNTTTNEFLIVIGDQDSKVYRFDADGNRLEDLGAESGNNPGDMNPGTPDAGDVQSDDAGSTQTPDSGTPGSTPAETPGSTPADPNSK